jgi:small neutral amino acid transporter SnatA (MarC family)
MKVSRYVSLAKGWCFRMLACATPLLFSLNAMAQESTSVSQDPHKFSFNLGEMFTFFFLMLGPLKILGPFVRITSKGDAKFARRVAIRAFVVSCVSLILAALIGENSLRRYHIRVAVLAIAGGIILFLVALRTVMEQFDTGNNASPKEYEPDMHLAIAPLAFPTIVTPYGVAAVIIFMALTPEFAAKSEIYIALLVLMVLNLIAMLAAKPILKYLGMPLLLLGTVLGVIQVALGLSMIFRGLQALGIGTGN